MRCTGPRRHRWSIRRPHRWAEWRYFVGTVNGRPAAQQSRQCEQCHLLQWVTL